MEPSFITIAQACERIGKSPSTVRRVIHTIIETEKHPDRAAIKPTPKEVAAFKKKEENFAWQIREDLIPKYFKTAPAQEKKQKLQASTDIMSVLQKELELKNQQIEKQWEVIHALNDRLREGNILMGSLQKHFALPEADSPAKDIVETVSTEASATPSKKGLRWWRRR